MSLTMAHVVFVAVMTAVGASLGRFVRQRVRWLRFLKESVRAVLFVAGTAAVVAYLAGAAVSAVAKAGLAGLYIGGVFGLVASEPRRRPPAPAETPSAAASEATPEGKGSGG
jgi:integral membrane sensor domain MASE1